MKIVIIGTGSVNTIHQRVLRKINKNFKILSISTRKIEKYKNKDFNELIKFNPDYILICSPSTFHYKHLQLIEKYFRKKIVLIEKPLFSDFKKLNKSLNNKYFVGYNLRFHPVIKFLKNYLKGKKIYFVRVNCSSYLPSWRKGKNYLDTVTSNKNLGGGVLLELSHEIDYLLWIFKKINIVNVINKKISDLKINTDDFLSLNAITSNRALINLTINFFSKIQNREIFIDGKNFNLCANVLKNSINLIEGKKKKIIKFNKFTMEDTYKFENLNILNKNFKDICSIKEGINLLKFISIVRRKNLNKRQLKILNELLKNEIL